MILNASQLVQGSRIQGEYCVIGAGPGGITVANELVRAGKDVILLESGGRGTSEAAQDLCKGEVLDKDRHGALHRYRHRRFGGTTDVWGGRCAPFDDVDFEDRAHVPWSGWPIGRREMDPYYARAHTYCDLGAYTYDGREALIDDATVMEARLRGSDVHSDFIWRFSLPTDFGRSFWREFSAARNLRVYLHATALQLRTSANRDRIESLETGSTGGKRFMVYARHFILASGGLEAARLLLVSQDGGAQGVGNARGLVGRFYSSHITGDLGEAVFAPEAVAAMSSYKRSRDGVYCRRALAVSQQVQREEGLLNFRAILSHPSPADPRHGDGVLSAMYLVKRHFAERIPPEYSKAMSAMSKTSQFAAHCSNIVTDCLGVAKFGTMWMRKRILSRRKLPSVLHENKANIYTLHFDAEQAPNPDSRVMLSDEKDEFGVNRLKVDWRCTQQDIDSVVRSAVLIDRALKESGLGKCLFDPERIGPEVAENTGVGSHHIGTTRMADEPSKGVVDRNCQVHGVANLSIASSAVFPTSSFANPTLTIVAIGIRLADHLMGRSVPESESIAMRGSAR